MLFDLVLVFHPGYDVKFRDGDAQCLPVANWSFDLIFPAKR
jgi:hypothetical protein